MTDEAPDFEAVLAARARIAPHLVVTPALDCAPLDALAGASLFFKPEAFQRTASFKARGALNAVLSLSEEQAARGVATHSSGNHGQAVAFAAARRGIPATVVVPRNALAVKRRAVAEYGARLVDCEPNIAAREATLRAAIAETGAEEIHPYADPRVIAGQGTCALELSEQVPDLDAVIAPVGGGGLLSGTAISLAARAPRTAVYGAEPAQADDAARSLHAERLIPEDGPDTIADGLRGALKPITFGIIRRHVADILTVSEAEIVEAMRLAWTRLKVLIEPSSAVALAAVLANKPLFAGKRVGVILTGGNCDPDAPPWRA